MAGYIGKSLAVGGTAVDAYSKTQSDAAYLKLSGGLMTGGVRQGVLAKSADYTVQTADPNVFLVTTAGSNRTMTLPAASAVGGQVYRFVKVDTGAGKLIIARAGSDTFGINANLTMELWFQDNYVDIMSDGSSRWIVMSSEMFIIPDASRTTTNYPNDGSTMDTWTDSDLSSVTPAGTSAVRMWSALQFTAGSGSTTDIVYVYLRKNGSSTSNNNATVANRVQHDNLTSGVTMSDIMEVEVALDIGRIFEWYLVKNTGTVTVQLNMNLRGYRLG